MSHPFTPEQNENYSHTHTHREKDPQKKVRSLMHLLQKFYIKSTGNGSWQLTQKKQWPQMLQNLVKRGNSTLWLPTRSSPKFSHFPQEPPHFSFMLFLQKHLCYLFVYNVVYQNTLHSREETSYIFDWNAPPSGTYGQRDEWWLHTELSLWQKSGGFPKYMHVWGFGKKQMSSELHCEGVYNSFDLAVRLSPSNYSVV